MMSLTQLATEGALDFGAWLSVGVVAIAVLSIAATTVWILKKDRAIPRGKGLRRVITNLCEIVVALFVFAFAAFAIIGWIDGNWDPYTQTWSPSARYKSRNSESRAGEARAALGTVMDRMRVLASKNGGKLVRPDGSAANKIEDFVSHADLDGIYYNAKNYSMDLRGEAPTYTGTLLLASTNLKSRSPAITLTVTDLTKGQATVVSP